jgi:hypothetical protein
VLIRYERVTFDRSRTRVSGAPGAQLLAPGHPLLDAVVDLTVEHHASTLKHGAVLVDRADPAETPRLLVALTQCIDDGHSPAQAVSKRFDFVELTPDGATRGAGPAPYLDYEPPSSEETPAVEAAVVEPWLARGAEDLALDWAIEHSLPGHRREVEGYLLPLVQRTREQVRRRLLSEINYWDTRHQELLDAEAAGRAPKIRPETAERRVRELEARLKHREADLDADGRLVALPPVVAGAALVLPQGLVDRLLGRRGEPLASYARDTAAVERRAVDARPRRRAGAGPPARGDAPQPPGYDVRSERPDGGAVRIEVKGRLAGADDFVITRNEVLAAKNLGDDYHLALVEVSPDGPADDQVRYVLRPFDGTGTEDFRVTRFTLNWPLTWADGGPPR